MMAEPSPRPTPRSHSSKTDDVAQQIARLLVTLPAGSRIPSIAELQLTVGAGSSTVQRALARLEELGAVVLRAKPKLGSFVEERDLAILWRQSGNPSVAPALALPNSREYQGLAAGLRAEFQRIGVPVSPLYAQGSQHRVEALLAQRIDFTVLSAGAAEEACEHHPELVVALRLAANTYYAPDSVVVISRDDREDPADPGTRVGIDEGSWDHRALSHAEFPGAALVQESYLYLPQAVLGGAIDLAVWHRTALGLSLDQQRLHIRPPSRAATVALADRLSAAWIVTRRTDEQTLGVLAEIDADAVVATQRGVVDQHVVPVF